MDQNTQITSVQAQVRENRGECFRRAPYFAGSNWMRPNRVNIHPEKRYRNECALPPKPKDSISQLESFSVLLSVVLMEINV